MNAPPPDADAPTPFPIVRASAVLAGVVSALAVGVHLLLTRALGSGVDGRLAGLVEANLIGAATCGGGGLVALLPVWLMSRKDRHGSAWGFMVGMLLRMLLCGAVIVTLQWKGYAHARPATFFMAGWYLAVLTAEVKLVSSFVLAHAGGPARTTGFATGPGPRRGAPERAPEETP